MATIKMALVMDIARRVNEDINDLQASHDQWGSEDYSDALGYVADLFNLASAQMLFNTYEDDDNEEIADQMTKALRQATLEAEQALLSLAHFGFSYTLDDLIN